MRQVVFALLIVACILGSRTASGSSGEHPDDWSIRSTVQIRSALLYRQQTSFEDNTGIFPQVTSQKRNSPLAFGLSAIVPGSGQVYNKQWIKAVVYLAVEGALATGYVVNHQRGLDGEEAYKDYAHSFWNPVRYATWLEDYTIYLNETFGGHISAPPAQAPSGIDFQRPDTWLYEDIIAVRGFFDQIRAIEGQVFHPETGASFSHKIPYFAEQQYYELIGKYFQFAPGWIDYPAWKEGETFTNAIDPEQTGSDGSKPNVQGRFLDYAADHAHSNDLLRRASRLSAFLLLNHLVAAIDAAVSAKLHNDHLTTDLSVHQDILGEVQTVATVRYTF